MRIKGWMGRADQTAKVKGMFVRPEQIAEIARRHPELGRLRLVVTREGEQDVMTLRAESAAPREALGAARRTPQAVHQAEGAGWSSSRPAACRTTARSLPTSVRWGDGLRRPKKGA